MRMKATEAELQIRFDERYPDASVKESVIKAFQESGLPVVVLPEIPYDGPKGGGGPVLDVNLILQHGPVILDGLIATGVWLGLVKAVRSLAKVYAAVRLTVFPKRYWRKRSDAGDSPEPRVIYEIPVWAGDNIEEYLAGIPADYAEIVKLTASLRAKGKAGDWETMQIEIYRQYIQPEGAPKIGG
jgi:hypothetical protein